MHIIGKQTYRRKNKNIDEVLPTYIRFCGYSEMTPLHWAYFSCTKIIDKFVFIRVY